MSEQSSPSPITLTRTSAISIGVIAMVLIPMLTFGLPKLWTWAKGTGQAEIKSEQVEERIGKVEETTVKLTDNMRVLTTIVKRIEENQAKQTQNWTYAHEILTHEMNKNRPAGEPIHPDDVIKYFENR